MVDKFRYAVSLPSLPQSNFEVYVPEIHNGRRVHLFLIFNQDPYVYNNVSLTFLTLNKQTFSSGRC